MKKLLSFVFAAILVVQAWAQSTDYLQQKDFQTEKKKIYDGINATKKQLNEIRKADARLVQSIDSIGRVLTMNSGEMTRNSDSITRTSARVSSLKEQIDNEKLPSRGAMILLFVICLILFVIVFLMLFFYKKRADTNHQSIIDLDKKTNERIDIAVTGLRNDVQSIRESVNALSSEMSQKISAGLTSLEAKNQQFEKQLKENLAGIEGTMGNFTKDIGKLKEEQSQVTKNLEDKLITIKREADLLNQGIATRIVKIEEELKLFKSKQ